MIRAKRITGFAFGLTRFSDSHNARDWFVFTFWPFGVRWIKLPFYRELMPRNYMKRSFAIGVISSLYETGDPRWYVRPPKQKQRPLYE